MTSHVLIYLYGLIAFVPHGGKMTIVLPDAQYPTFASTGCVNPAHVPAILFPVGQPLASPPNPQRPRPPRFFELCTPRSRRDSCWFHATPIEPQTEPFGSWLLDGYGYNLEIDGVDMDLTTLPATSKSRAEEEIVETQDPIPHSSAEAASFRWAPRMSMVRGKTSPIMDGCKDNGTCASIASLTLPAQAQPRTCHLADGTGGRTYAYSFHKLTTPDLASSRQALSDVTRIALSIRGGRRSVVLRAVPRPAPEGAPEGVFREVTLTADVNNEILDPLRQPSLASLPSNFRTALSYE